MASATTSARAWVGWGIALGLVVVWWVGVHGRVAAWVSMWGLSVAVFAGCKAVTWVGRPGVGRVVPGWRHAGYLVGWPGLHAGRFLYGRVGGSAGGCTGRAAPSASRCGRGVWADAREWVHALVCLAGGGCALGVAVCWVEARPTAAAWVGMVGVVLVLHFGVLALIGLAWRAVGVDAPALMRRPTRSVSLADFWGRRWNTAFRDLTHRHLFVPIALRVGAGGATWCCFAFSGVVHDGVVSVPAGGGYGGPTAYFLVQAAGVSVERAWGRRAHRLGQAPPPTGFAGHLPRGAGEGFRRRVFAWVVVVAPLPLCFHGAFRGAVVVPMLEAIGGLW